MKVIGIESKQVQSESGLVAKAPVTFRAVLARLNRRLAHEQQVVRTSRSERSCMELGVHYAVDTDFNVVVTTNVDVEEWARELGVLRSWEAVVEGGAS